MPPAIHFGVIASGDIVMKSGEERHSIARTCKPLLRTNRRRILPVLKIQRFSTLPFLHPPTTHPPSIAGTAGA
jgi:hypothetical protein